MEKWQSRPSWTKKRQLLELFVNNGMLESSWEDDHCQILSGFEGDLSEPGATIKIILNEIQE